MGGMKNTAKRGAAVGRAKTIRPAALFDRALARVESDSIRAWANSPHNRAGSEERYESCSIRF